MTKDISLVQEVNGQPMTNTLVIADQTGNQHKNVLGLVRAHLADLQEFGGVAFETRPFETAGGVQEREIAWLNEPQTSLLITYMRNSGEVRFFKKAIIREFFYMREQLATKKSKLGGVDPEKQMRIMQMAKGLVDPGHLEAKVRIIMGRVLGEVPEIPQAERPLYAEDFLYSKGLNRDVVKAVRSSFGRRCSLAYEAEHGEKPGFAPAEVGGRVRNIRAYTESDRELFEQVWSEHFADKFDSNMEITA